MIRGWERTAAGNGRRYSQRLQKKRRCVRRRFGPRVGQ
nr:MAG TPA: hypothetical protein [Caudoviricetes sp.]